MKKIIRLTESDLNRVIRKIVEITESDGNFRDEFEYQIDSIINEYGIPEDMSYEELAGLELRDISYNLDEMIYSFKSLRELVETHKENMVGKKKTSIFGKFFGTNKSEMIKPTEVKTNTTREINRKVLELGRSYLLSRDIIPANVRINMFDSMIDILTDKIDYAQELNKEIKSGLKDRKNYLSKKGKL